MPEVSSNQVSDTDSGTTLPDLPSVLLAGFAAFPKPTESALTQQSGLTFVWQREDADGWQEVGHGLTYVPSGEDVGRRLRLLGKRPGAGDAAICRVTEPVQHGPGPCPFQRRHKQTEKPLGQDSCRVVTYNILADVYAIRDEAKMPYCPLTAQKIEYRKQLLLSELLGYNADVLCLQEVDREVYDDYFAPLLAAAGLDGTFAKKRDLPDGAAIFWRRDKLGMLSTERPVLSELSQDPLYTDIRKALTDNVQLSDSFLELPHVINVTVLEEKSAPKGRPIRRLVVANTHLYYNDDTEHLRALQVGLGVRHLQRAMDEVLAETPNQKVALVFCGDFNSEPHQSVYRLMTRGQMSVKDFNQSKEEDVRGVTFRHPYKMESACGTPEYTTHTHVVQCVDYMFYMKDKLKLEQVVPLPSDEEVKKHTALPSIVFPSDHLALVADFSWR